jgi:putative oxidoreductase
MDTALLLIRLVVGLTLAAHGAQKVFGAFGGHGIGGTAGLLESMGFRPGRAHAWLLALAELVGGLLFAVGLLTPLAAAALAGSMIGAIITVHLDKGFFAQGGGFEYPFVLAVVAVAVAFSGPGRYSLDNAFGIVTTTEGWGIAAVVVAVISAGAILGLRQVRTGTGTAASAP